MPGEGRNRPPASGEAIGAPVATRAGARAGQPSLAIDSLHVQVPGSSRAVGDRVARLLPERLAERLPADAQGHFGRLDLEVHVPPGASPTRISEAIAESILRALARSKQEHG